MFTRRQFVRTGGGLLAGLIAAPPLVVPRRSVVEIAMRSDLSGGNVWFDPIGLMVEPGQTVRWILHEGVHTATAYHPANYDRALRIPEGATPWDSGYLVDRGDTFDVTVSVEGVYDYFCLPHEAAGMVGRLVVGKPGATAGGPDDADLPRAVRLALPEVERIVREGVVRRTGRGTAP